MLVVKATIQRQGRLMQGEVVVVQVQLAFKEQPLQVVMEVLVCHLA
jgi:hypothetical protein